MRRSLALVATLIGAGLLATGPARAEDLERMLARKCKHPHYLVPLTAGQFEALQNATKLLTEARLCPNMNKPEPPREPGCLVDTIVKGGAFDKLALKNGDYVIGGHDGAILSIEELLKTLDSLRKKKSGCLVVNRKDFTLGIGYRLRKRPQVH